jgi:hypothetical protein
MDVYLHFFFRGSAAKKKYKQVNLLGNAVGVFYTIGAPGQWLGAPFA